MTEIKNNDSVHNIFFATKTLWTVFTIESLEAPLDYEIMSNLAAWSS